MNKNNNSKSMKKIAQGAEAILYRKNDFLIKDRIKKGYRIKQLDKKIREERTRLESNLISKARRAGANTPVIMKVTENKIKMEFIDGKRLKEYLNELPAKKRNEICKTIGEEIAKIHKNDLIHGDLTTSNMIWKNKLYFIDFGLGYYSGSIEDKATDLHVLEESLESTHFSFWKEAFEKVIEGYKKYKGSNKVLNRLKKVRKRGRYVKKH